MASGTMAPTYRQRFAASLGPVTRTPLGMLARSLAVVSIAVTLSLTYAAAASADVPEGWDTPPDVSFMHTLLVLVLIFRPTGLLGRPEVEKV